MVDPDGHAEVQPLPVDAVTFPPTRIRATSTTAMILGQWPETLNVGMKDGLRQARVAVV